MLFWHPTPSAPVATPGKTTSPAGAVTCQGSSPLPAKGVHAPMPSPRPMLPPGREVVPCRAGAPVSRVPPAGPCPTNAETSARHISRRRRVNTRACAFVASHCLFRCRNSLACFRANFVGAFFCISSSCDARSNTLSTTRRGVGLREGGLGHTVSCGIQEHLVQLPCVALVLRCFEERDPLALGNIVRQCTLVFKAMHPSHRRLEAGVRRISKWGSRSSVCVVWRWRSVA